jgi:pimeloyl-ACP methyl ester carboxylesterase
MDIALHYIEKGEGEPLILLHGNGESGEYFLHQLAFFSEHYRVIAVDTRGHGKSPRGDAPFTIRQFAEDLRGFLDAQGIAQANLLGFSDGGNIALIFALRYPQRVKRLILNGANLDTKGVKPSVQLPITLGFHVASLFAGKRPEARRNAELLGLMVNDPSIPPDALTELEVPTLVIAGTRDMIKTSHTRQIAASIPGAELVLLQGDHFIANKNPGPFNAAVQRFLQKGAGQDGV